VKYQVGLKHFTGKKMSETLTEHFQRIKQKKSSIIRLIGRRAQKKGTTKSKNTNSVGSKEGRWRLPERRNTKRGKVSRVEKAV